jgi:transposase
VIRNVNADGFNSLYPEYRGGHPRKFALPQRREIKKIAKANPVASATAPRTSALTPAVLVAETTP